MVALESKFKEGFKVLGWSEESISEIWVLRLRRNLGVPARADVRMGCES